MKRPNSRRSTPSGSVFSQSPTVATTVSLPAPKTSTQMSAKPNTPPQVPFNFDKYKQLKQVAQNAIEDKKIFTIFRPFGTCVHWPLRKALTQRGWTEKLHPNQLKPLQCKSQHTLLHNAARGNQFEVAALSKMLHAVPVHFIWQPKYMRLDQPIDALAFRNRLTRCNSTDFTRKECLVGCTKQLQWMHINGRSELNCPRSYRMFIADEVDDFVTDYQFTGCISLVSRIANAIADTSSVFAPGGSVKTTCIGFAIRHISEFLRRQQHCDIDTGCVSDVPNVAQWEEFFKDFNAIVRLRGRLREGNTGVQRQWCEDCGKLMVTIRSKMSLAAGDGENNIWIMKPGGKNCGIGILVVHDCQEIIGIAARARHHRYIVQKYLERPLLIHKTKFDIRQYFLMVVRSQCTQLWMYRTCYLKFSSQEFRLDSVDEVVHLTNHCVQRKYTNQKNRSPLLPNNNMWTLQQFKDHLVSIGEGDAWSSKIYPSMKRNVIATMIATNDELNAHPNAFELYGGDFIINEKFESVMLEVNASPDLSATTAVTRKICPECLEDVVKVVVDKTINPNAATGNFELIHQIATTNFQPAENLIVTGVKKPILAPMRVRHTTARSSPIGPERPPSISKVATALKANATSKPTGQVRINRVIKQNVNADLIKAKQTPQARINHQDSRTKRLDRLLELHDLIGCLLHSSHGNQKLKNCVRGMVCGPSVFT